MEDFNKQHRMLVTVRVCMKKFGLGRGTSIGLLQWQYGMILNSINNDCGQLPSILMWKVRDAGMSARLGNMTTVTAWRRNGLVHYNLLIPIPSNSLSTQV
jgi:hypothetical protein